MADIRKKKLLEEFGLAEAGQVELVSTAVLILSGLENPFVMRKVYGHNGLRSMELVSAVLQQLKAGTGLWRIIPPSRKHGPIPMFSVENILNSGKEASWIEVLRFAELFLSTKVEVSDPKTLDPELCPDEKFEDSTSYPLAITTDHIVVAEDDTFVHEPGFLPEEDGDVSAQPGDCLLVAAEHEGEIHTPLILSGQGRGELNRSSLVHALSDMNSMGHRTRQGFDALVPWFSRSRIRLTDHHIRYECNAFRRLKALASTNTGFLCRLTADYYGSPAIDWGGSYIRIGKNRFSLIDYSTFVGYPPSGG